MKKQNLLLIPIICGILLGCNINAKAQTISGGGYHSLGICNSNFPLSWGCNAEGQLGNGNNNFSPLPDSVSFLTGITAVAAGERHSLALKNDSTVWSFGLNNFGQLGNGTTNNSNVSVQVSSLSSITAIASGWNHSYALRNDSTLWTWGWNVYGQLGNGTNTDSYVPVQVTTLTGLNSVIAGSGGQFHSLALKSDGTVWAWGSNGYGQLGNGNNTDSNVPIQISSLTGIIAVAAGGYHSLALKNDGTLWAWGFNGEGQLGNGSNAQSNVPLQVSSISGLSGSIAIAAGERHSLALKNDGTVWAWGHNNVGELGNGNNTDSNVPVPASTSTGLTNIVSISAGRGHSLAVKNDASVRVWGWNSCGQFGNGNTTNSNIPLPITTLCPLVSVNEIIESIFVSIYPNPNNGVFTLSLNPNFNSRLRNIEIYNTLGENIYMKNIAAAQDKIAIDLSAQSKGIYLVKIQSKDFQETQKLIITK